MLGTLSEPFSSQMSHICDISALTVNKTYLGHLVATLQNSKVSLF